MTNSTHPDHGARAPAPLAEGIVLMTDHTLSEYWVAIDGSTSCKADVRTALSFLDEQGWILLTEDEHPADVMEGGVVRIWLTTDRWDMMC